MRAAVGSNEVGAGAAGAGAGATAGVAGRGLGGGGGRHRGVVRGDTLDTGALDALSTIAGALGANATTDATDTIDPSGAAPASTPGVALAVVSGDRNATKRATIARSPRPSATAPSLTYGNQARLSGRNDGVAGAPVAVARCNEGEGNGCVNACTVGSRSRGG